MESTEKSRLAGRWVPLFLLATLTILGAGWAIRRWIWNGDAFAKARVYRIGYGDDAPYHFRKPDGSEAGLAVDMVKEAARRRGIQLEWHHFQNGGPTPIQSGELDFWVLLTDRTDRRKIVHLTEPYLATQTCFLVPDNIRKVGDLAGARVSRLKYGIHRLNLAAILPTATPVEVDSTVEAISAVAAGRADAAYLDQYTAMIALLSGISKTPLGLLRAPVPRSYMALASSFETIPVADDIRAAMRTLAEDGTVSVLSERWGFFASLSTDVIEQYDRQKRVTQMLWLGVSALGIVLGITLALAERLRRERNTAKQQEQALLESEERWELVLRGTNDGIWDHDISTNRIYYSDRWKGMLGYAPEELENHLDTWAQLVHPDDRDRANAMLQAHLSGASEVYSCEYRLRTKSGQYRWILARGRALRNDAGKAVRLAGSHTDITERRTAEELADVSRRQAEAASRAKSEFLANMSHEIRTPAGALVSLSRLLPRESNAQERLRLAELLEISGEALLRVINDVLDISKIEAGKLAIHNEPARLATLAKQVLALMEPAAQTKQLSIRFVDDGGTAEPVMTDAARVRQVLMNLIGNAVKFTDRGEVTVTLDQKEAIARFSVRDTGPGIPAGAKAMLFQPFCQLDGTASRAQGGTGLGLAISARLTALMGGRIGVESEPGEGSCFWFEIPAVGATERIEAEAAVAPAADVSDLRVLVAEDNQINRVICCRLLEGLGIRPDVAEDGLRAVSAAAHRDYDLILMDVQMPIMDGLEATRRIRQTHGHQPCIVALTAHVLGEHRQACMEVGMDGHLTKPLDILILRPILDRLANARPSPRAVEESSVSISLAPPL